MKIELTIKTDYLPNWEVWEGIRELMQNGRDAEVELDAKLTVDWYNDTLRIENDGCTLPHEALLLGHTTKADRDDTIGKFGEGLKLGVLALVRQGMPVKIRSGSEVWTPTIERSEKFNADVLVFDIQGGRKPENRVRVEIGSMPKDIWEAAKWKFLFLNPDSEKSIKTHSGTLLLDPKLKGATFVKGIYVNNDSKLEYGYDLFRADLDRDRRMVDKYDFMFRVKDIWEEAMRSREDLLQPFTTMLDKQAKDIEGVEDYCAKGMDPKVLEYVANDFKAKHGENAVPVQTLSESKDLDHLGKKGVIVNKNLASVLAQKLPTATQVKEELRDEVTARHGWSDLTGDEKANLTGCVELLNASGVVTTSLESIEVCTFRSPEILGLYKNGKALLSKARLAKFEDALEVLVHEVAHQKGGDGDKTHVATIEATWKGIVASLRK